MTIDITTYYKQLENCRIKEFKGFNDDGFGGEGFPCFVVVQSYVDLDQGKLVHRELEVEVSADPEGNGGGFLFIGEGGEK